MARTDFERTLHGLGSYSIPIFRLDRRARTPYLVGSGTLYRDGADVFLVSAKHVMDELADGSIVTSGKEGFLRFKADMAVIEHQRGDGRDHDICVTHIPRKAIDGLHGHLEIVGTHQLSTIAPHDKFTLYAFVGYPHSKNKPKPRSVGGSIELKPFYYVFREFVDLGTLDTTDKTPDLHAAFKASLSAMKDVNLERTIHAPKPHGISGCGVWMLRLNKTTGLVDECALVAVGIEYVQKNEAFVATRIESPLRAIKEFQHLLAGKPVR